MPKIPQSWMVKQEPTTYSWDQFVKDGRAAWTGVRNYQARNNLRAMRKGDAVFYYHSVVGKEVVGLARVATVAYPDPTTKEEGWVCVDLVPVKPLRRSVPLTEIKADARLKDCALVRNSRISVMPITAAEHAAILQLAEA